MKRLIILLSVVMFLASAFHSSVADEVNDIGSVTALVTSEEVREGDPNADEEEARNQSNFPENPELYIPMPLPQGKEYGESSTVEESGWVSYDVSTGEEFICESPLMEKDFPITSRSKGGKGLRLESQVSNGSFLNFTDLTWIDNPEDYPWSVNCKAFIETLLGTYVCSGVLIDPLHVLTAGHCVYNEDLGGWPIGIDVVPGYEDGFGPYGVASMINLHAPLDWINNRDYDHDIGIITLDRPIGAITGWHGYSYNNDDLFFLNNTFNNPGYPAAPPYDGEFMYYWFGNYDYIWNPFQIGFFQQAYGGQSGSGSYYFDGLSGRWVYAVLSNGNDIMTNHVRITPTKFSNISDIIANNTPSTFDLIPLRVRPSEFIITAGEQFSSMEYLVHNYSYVSWNGTVDVGVYLSEDSNISPTDTLIQSHNFTWSFDPKSTVLIGISSPPTIPEGTAEGFYYIGVILNITDYNILNNESDGQDAALIYVMPNIDLDNDGSGDACDIDTFCKGLADYDQDVDADDVTVFLSHFGRHQFNNPCPPDGPAPVAKTGQKTSYATGDDGDLESGIAVVTPRFTDNGDGTVTDHQTGLIWLKDANCFGQEGLFSALLDSSGLADGQCGLTDGSSVGDWRLPNRFELESLLNLEYYNPALPDTAGTGQWSEGDPFNNVQSYYYWSSTTVFSSPLNAWSVVMASGGVSANGKSGLLYVWPVRGGH